MANVYKKITRGASYCQTDAVADIDFAKKAGFMPCGNGDDHCLNTAELALIEQHDAATGDLELPSGRLGRRILARFRG